MVKMASSSSSSPSSSPVTITVSTSGTAQNIGLTSPIRRFSVSNNPNSPLSNRGLRGSGGGRYLSMSTDKTEECVAYTVHIPPTPERQFVSDSQSSFVSDSNNAGHPLGCCIKDTIYTGGFNSVTRAHVIENSVEENKAAKSHVVCGMEGCDERAQDCTWKAQCECGFKICRDCYLECIGNGGGGGYCPGCKEPYKEDVSDDESNEQPSSEEKDQPHPLPRGGNGGNGIKLEKNFSLVQSFKAPNHDFDHTRWLFETKGTYGYGNAVWPKDGYEFGRGTDAFDNPPQFNDRRNRPLTRKVGVSTAIISPYRFVLETGLSVS